MATNSLLCFYLLSLSLTLILLVNNASARHLPVSWPPTEAPAAGTVDNSTEFIRTSCQATLYPDLCFASLVRYAPAVQHDPVRLARIATKAAFSQIHYTKARVSAYLRKGATGQEADALEDCVESLGNAADQMRRSASEIGKLDHVAVVTEVAWRVSNAQTWMSAALTNEETCTDGLKEAGAKMSVMADVGSRVGVAKQFTSIALALVNELATTP